MALRSVIRSDPNPRNSIFPWLVPMKRITRPMATLTCRFRLQPHDSMRAQFRVAVDDSTAVDTTVLRTRDSAAVNVLQLSVAFEM